MHKRHKARYGSQSPSHLVMLGAVQRELDEEVPTNSNRCTGNLQKDCRKYNNASRTLQASEKGLRIKHVYSKLG